MDDTMTKDEKKEQAKKRKELREELKSKYGIAKMSLKKDEVVDVEVGNYMAEPPGIFIGRGEHPLRGKWKPRVTAKDVILNMDEDAKVPKGDWLEIRHDHDSMWLASWMDFLTQKRKYVWLSDSSDLKQGRDKEKYEKAVNLESQIEKIKKLPKSGFSGTLSFGSHKMQLRFFCFCLFLFLFYIRHSCIFCTYLFYAFSLILAKVKRF